LKARVIILICFFMLIASQARGQRYKLLRGNVSHPTLSLEQIHVINTSRGVAEITDIYGAFELSVAVGEKIIFSGIQFHETEILISEELFSSAEITVYLKAKINELKEVVVKPHELSGSLSSDISTVPKKINFSDVGIPGFKGQREEKIVSGKSLLLSTLLLPVSGGINVDAVYKHLSGYYKKLKKRRSLDKQFEAVYSIIQFYGVYFFTENYGIEQDQIYDFVLGCSQNTPLISYYKKGMHTQVMEAFDHYKVGRYEN